MPNPLQTALAPPWRGAQPWLIQAIFQAAFYKHLLALSLEYFSQSNVSQQSQNRSHNGTGNCLIAKLISQRRSEGNIQITFGRLLRLFLIPGAFDCFGGNCPATYSTSVQMNKPREEISSEKISKFLKKDRALGRSSSSRGANRPSTGNVAPAPPGPGLIAGDSGCTDKHHCSV